MFAEATKFLNQSAQESVAGVKFSHVLSTQYLTQIHNSMWKTKMFQVLRTAILEGVPGIRMF